MTSTGEKLTLKTNRQVWDIVLDINKSYRKRDQVTMILFIKFELDFEISLHGNYSNCMVCGKHFHFSLYKVFIIEVVPLPSPKFN